MTKTDNFSRRDFVKLAGSASLAGAAGLSLPRSSTAQAKETSQYNILMIVTDQERYMAPTDLPIGYRLPGHEKLASRSVVFENHQVASCVCTPSRAVLYTGQHIQNNKMFDNTNFPWSSDLSTDIPTVGDMLRDLGYYTAYKGKWHLTDEFETANDAHNPTRLLSKEMEEYGFSDYFGVGDIIAHTEGGYLHDGIIAAMTKSWLRGKAMKLNAENKPWFMAVNLVNPHDVMYYNTDKPGDAKKQAELAMMRLNHDPNTEQFARQWDINLPVSRNQAVTQPGRPKAHKDYAMSRAGLVGLVPNEDARWRRLNNYYFNCVQAVDRHVLNIVDELEDLGIADNTIIVFTADHGELAGAHGMNGKGANGYREQLNVPLVVSHPGFAGDKRCKAVTSHLDIAPSLISFAGGKPEAVNGVAGSDISPVLGNPQAASFDAIRPGALFNYNMLAYLDSDFMLSVSKFIREGGKPEDLPKQGFKPNLSKRGAIRSVFDGRYKLTRYFSPQEHHTPNTLEELFANNDVELYDLKSDPHEMVNLAADGRRNGELIVAMLGKLNALIKAEVGEDIGQMMPGGADSNWRLDPSISNLRM